QFYLNSGLKDSAKNRAIVDSRWEEIQREISLGIFDPTLDRYRFGVKHSIPLEIKIEYSLSEVWEKFCEFQKHQIEKTTILGKYHDMERRILKFPSNSLNDAPIIRDWILANYSRFTAWDTISHLIRCCDWAVESKVIIINPFKNLNILRPKKKSTDSDYRAYNAQQRDLIISAFETDSLFGYYTPLIKFLFWCGSRHGEAFALQWKDISADCTKIKIYQSCNSEGILKGTKNSKKRLFPCSPGSKLNLLLLDLRQNSSDDDLIFRSKTGEKMNSIILGGCWRISSWGRDGVVRRLEKEGQVPYLRPYGTRHTFATLAIASGVSPDKVAYWLGDDVATVLKFYCHPEVVAADCPDF
ncbi:tyrosine-type recombinase/integrase, partial [Cylindrospermum sp. FACHB-282]|uniref:tyrosine-type recombinase/integrase n=1 Tax=Cylindrospermum sp. FACHB-282 TaxID=2692794 RepID=UPI00168A0D55